MRKIAITLAVLAVCGLATTAVQAGPYNGYGYNYGGRGWQRGAIYHPPSVHFDPLYHADYSHWTPGRGLHTHGHIDYVPHYTPGHRDLRHGNHIHVNPRFHH